VARSICGSQNYEMKYLLGGSLFAVGLALYVAGVWAGVTRSWPVRYPLKLIEGRPKPVSVMPESRHLAIDRAGRLLDYPGKVEVQCPDPTPGTAVILIAGQSNAANSGAQRHTTHYPDRVLNFVAGRCFVAASPLLGSTGLAGEPWTPLADQLIQSGSYDHIILASVAVSGSAIFQWAVGGELNTTMKPLVMELVSRYRVTHVLWHQGESDFIIGTDAARYKEQFLSFAASLRAEGVDAPIYVSKATRCGPGWKAPNAVRIAQQDLVDTQSGVERGIDTDLLLEFQDRYDDCHFAESGLLKSANAWADLLLSKTNSDRAKTAARR
jgi:Carbohydrate esterase, sialic acid-specific acetylesterase